MMHVLMRVFVAIDLSTAADATLREAVSLTSTSDALAVLLVLPARPVVGTTFAVDALRERVARATGRSAEIYIAGGMDDAGTIVRGSDAWRADLIVVGGATLHGIAKMVGGIPERVLRHAHCRVLVAHPTVARGVVIAATDLSDPSLPVVTVGAEEAHRRGAKLEVVHAVGAFQVEATYLIERETPTMGGRIDEATAARRQLSEALARLGIEAKCVISDSPPAAAVVCEAETVGAELIVVATHRPTGLARFARGSIAEKIIRAAPCSVLAVRRTLTAVAA
jgi:universal stress protein A